MTNLRHWIDTIEKLPTTPIDFVMGFRHIVSKGFYCPPHYHPFLEIVYHPSGRGISRVGDTQEITFQEDDALIYPAGIPHDQTVEKSGEDWCIQMAIPFPISPESEALHIPSIESPALIEEIRNLSQGSRKHPNSIHAVLNLRATTVLSELVFLEKSRKKAGKYTTTERYVADAEKFIAEYFWKIDSLKQIAKEIGVGYDHLRHSFKLLRKKSLIQHVNEVKIERAKELLLHSRIPLKQVATMCGFKDEYYFSSVFKKHAQLAPGQYRDQNEKNIRQ